MKNDTPTSLRAKPRLPDGQGGNLIEQGIASVFTRLRNDGLVLLLLLLLSIPLTIQLFHPGFFVGDDGEWMIIRSSAFHEAFRDGQIPVRLLGRLNHEFGYPAATFLYPGYLYLTEPLIIAGFGFIDSTKIMFTLTMVFSGILAYLWFSKLFNRWAALLGALVYLYTPYHLVDMYNRGSLGELLALAVVPFIFWNIERRSLLFSSIGIAGLILSHNIMAALFLPLILLYAFLRNSQSFKKNIVSVSLLLLFGLSLASFFWIPALFELQYTVFNQTKISEWQNYFATFAKIGGLPLTLFAASIAVLLFQKQLKDPKSFLQIKKIDTRFVLFTITGLLAVFLSCSCSAFLWNILPVTFIQFPFRFLSLELIAAAFLAAYLLDHLRHKVFVSIFSIIIFLALFINAIPYLRDIPSYDKGEGFYVTNQSTTTTRDEYMPVWVKEKPTERAKEKVQIIKGAGEISNTSITNKKITFTVRAKQNTVVQINKIYWPGWVAMIDDEPGTINYQNSKGLMTIRVSQGNHTIHLYFQETPLRLFADIMSGISFIVLLLFVFLSKRKSHSNTRKK